MFYKQRRIFVFMNAQKEKYGNIGLDDLKQICKAQTQLELGLGPTMSRGLSYILMDTLIDVRLFPHSLDDRLRLCFPLVSFLLPLLSILL